MQIESPGGGEGGGGLAFIECRAKHKNQPFQANPLESHSYKLRVYSSQSQTIQTKAKPKPKPKQSNSYTFK